MNRNDTIMADESWKKLWSMADWRVAARAGEWVKGVEEDKRRQVDFTEAGMCIIDHSRNICIIGSLLRLVSDCVLEVTCQADLRIGFQ